MSIDSGVAGHGGFVSEEEFRHARSEHLQQREQECEERQQHMERHRARREHREGGMSRGGVTGGGNC